MQCAGGAQWTSRLGVVLRARAWWASTSGRVRTRQPSSCCTRQKYLPFPGAPVPPTALPWLSSAKPAFLRTCPESSEGPRLPAAVSPSGDSPSLRRSVFYPVASPVALFLAAAHCFFFDCARYATLICLLSPPLDASAWAEISLALVGDTVAY